MNIDFEKIKVLKEELARLLEERPEYKPMQEQIDRELAKCGDISSTKDPQERARIRRNRCAVIQDMMLTKWKEFIPAAEELKRANQEFQAAGRVYIEEMKEEIERQKKETE